MRKAEECKERCQYAVDCSMPEYSCADECQYAERECPHCFESSGYVWEHGNDWDSGPWSVQTNIRCSECDGSGHVEMEDAIDAELFEYFEDALDALVAA